MSEVANEFEKLGFKVTRYFDYNQLDIRFKKGYSIIHRIDLNGHVNYRLWMKIIGFKNPRHLIKCELMSKQYNLGLFFCFLKYIFSSSNGHWTSSHEIYKERLPITHFKK